MKRIRNALAAAIVVALVNAPAVARACSVCVDPNAESRTAFIITTVLLSVLPLLLVGGMVAWLWRRSQQVRAEWAESNPVAEAQLGRVSSPLAAAGSSRSTSSR